jgi:dipeptidyl aminopeptidase/acylaminoacyl peptidase
MLRLWLLPLVAWAFTISAVHAAPSLSAYGELPNVQEITLSPDGQYMALIVGNGNLREVQIRRTEDRKVINASETGSLKVRGVVWAGSHHLLLITSQATEIMGLSGPKGEYSLLSDFDLRKGRWSRLMDGQEHALNAIVGHPVHRVIKGKDVVFVEGEYFPGRQGVLALYRIELDTGYTSRQIEGTDITTGWLLDDQGEPYARTDYINRTGKWSLKLMIKRQWITAETQQAPIDPPTVLGLDQDGKAILLSEHQDGQVVNKAISLIDGTVTPAPLKPGQSLIFDPKTRNAIGAVRLGAENREYSFFSPKDQAAWAAVERGFAHHLLGLSSWSEDRSRVIVHAEGETYGDGYFLVDMTAKTADWIADAYTNILPQDVAPVKFMHYAAADGLSLPAYLTLPRDRPAKALPLVVLVHGGPAARDPPGFDWWAQAFAAQGYAVLQPEYRGSEGFGEKLLEAGYGEWGKKMQSDISDGVRALVKQGFVDPARVCIAGGSYGGYAALAGAVFDASVYRCALSLAGPSDLRQMLDYSMERHNYDSNREVRYWERFMGATKPDDRFLDTISPARHADQAGVPILLIHGKDDTVVTYEQSEEMARALKRAGKPYNFVTLKDEDHWLSRSQTRLQMLEAMVDFLKVHNPPDPPQAKTADAGVASSAVSH